MRNLLRNLTVGISAGLIVCACCGARADEEKVPLEKLPKAIMEVVKKRFPRAEIVEAAKESEDGKTEFEVTVKEGNRKTDVSLTPDGTITLIEREIAASDVPKPVKESLDRKYPKATWKTIEEVFSVKDGKEKLDYYEVLLETADKHKVEVEIEVDGKIKATEDKQGKN